MILQHRAAALRERYRAELHKRYPSLRQTARSKPAVPSEVPQTSATRGKRIVIGVDPNGLPFVLPDSSRSLHTHILGVPKSGKSFAMFHQIRQDILNGASVIVLDPHGAHAQSIFNLTMRWLVSSGVAKERRVHVFDPSASRTCGYNALACPAGVDASVIANNALEAVARGWGDEDTQEKPTLRRGLRAALLAAVELRLTLLEVPLFLLPDDPYSARAWALETLKDERARSYLERLERLAANPRLAQGFDVEVVGILNRLEEFTSSRAIRRILGQTEGLELSEVMDNGEVLLVNLSGGDHFYEAEGDLLGRLMLRGVLFHGKRRRNLRPAMVWCDEGHRYLSGDIPNALEELRKYSIGIVIAHQTISQLGLPGDRIREAVLKVPQNRLLFRLNSMEEATTMAPELVKLNLEMPVALLTKPTITDYEIRSLKTASTGGAHAIGSSHSQTVTHEQSENSSQSQGGSTAHTDSKERSRGKTRGRSRSVAEGTADTIAITESQSDSRGTTDTTSAMENYGSASAVGGSHAAQSGWSTDTGQGDAYSNTTEPFTNRWPDRTQSTNNSRGENAAISDAQNWSESETNGTATGSSHSDVYMRTEGTAKTKSHADSRVVTEGESESESETELIGESESRGRTWATTAGRGSAKAVGHTAGTTATDTAQWTKGTSETLAPVLKDLPMSVHSKENVIHMAAELINQLPTGTAIVKALVNSRIESALVRLPLAADSKEQYEGYAKAWLLERMPKALPIAEADRLIQERHEQLKMEGLKLVEEPETFRIKVPGKGRE